MLIYFLLVESELIFLNFFRQPLRASLSALCHKVLIYRDIDIPFSVACLAALPYDAMVKELKTAVPSIQSDFSRLQTVAQVGEELAHLWEQEGLLVLFQDLQANAKWWHVLSSLGMKVDLRVFQSPDAQQRDSFIRSIIPELFEKGGMDLEMVTEYCRQFDLEPEYAALMYIELMLTSAPTAPTDFTWAAKVRAAAENVQEHSVLQRLRDILHRVNALDYEKVRYVCTWIIDLLSAEEAPEDAYNEESDYTTTSFSVRDKPKKVSTAVLLAERGVIHELETYKRYLDIVGYLSGFKFPRLATAAIQSSMRTPSPYAQAGAVYQERVPLWPLLEDPWSVLDPLLTQMPESAAKLAPLCVPLHLDKSDFNFRKIIALYARMTNKLTQTGLDAVGVLPSASHVEGKRTAMRAAADALEASLVSPVQQMELWQWVYERETKESDDENALVALTSALAVARDNPGLLVSQSKIKSIAAAQSTESVSSDQTLLAHFSREMRMVKCRCTVRSFARHMVACPRAADMLQVSIAQPSQLVRNMLDVMATVGWDIFVRGCGSVGAPITALTLAQHPPNQAFVDFVQQAGAEVAEIARHCGLDQLAVPGEGSPTAAAGAPQTTQLDLMRHNLIGKMLSDVDSAGAEKDNNTVSAAAASTGKGLWGGSSEATYNPSVAERRRREDIYLSLSIANLVLSCSSSSQRYC